MNVFSAFVIIHADLLRATEVEQRLSELNSVRFAHRISGPGTLIIFIEAETVDQFRLILDRAVRQCPYVISTDTRPVIMVPDLDFQFWDADVKYSSDEYAAWVFLRLSVGDPHSILMDVRSIPGVASAHAIVGADDGLAFSKARGPSELLRLMESIEGVPGVRRAEFRMVITTTTGDESP